jgi:hypothetical protein
MFAQVCNFLNYMAFETDLDSLKALPNQEKMSVFKGGNFDPMRRRMANIQ